MRKTQYYRERLVYLCCTAIVTVKVELIKQKDGLESPVMRSQGYSESRENCNE